MDKLLHSVTGNAKLCAPCSWSALTGLSSDTWPDKPMNDYEEWGELEKLRFEHAAPFYVEKFSNHLFGSSLREFCEEGRWALTLKWDGDEEEHAVAAGVRGSERLLADNHIRDPLPLETVIEQHDLYRTAVVVFGLQLVPDTPLIWA